MDLHVQRWGEQGPKVILVHGSVVSGEMTWAEQRPLADRCRLAVVHRPATSPTRPPTIEDFAEDVPDIVELLGEGAHLAGHSYGGVVSLLVAAQRPELVRSLTVVEPPAFGVALDDDEVRAFADELSRYWEQGPRDPEAFLRGFLELVGSSARLPSPLPPPLRAPSSDGGAPPDGRPSSLETCERRPSPSSWSPAPTADASTRSATCSRESWARSAPSSPEPGTACRDGRRSTTGSRHSWTGQRRREGPPSRDAPGPPSAHAAPHQAQTKRTPWSHPNRRTKQNSSCECITARTSWCSRTRGTSEALD